MAKELDGLKVAIVVENGFEQVEMTEPRKALDAAGAQTSLISPVQGHVKGWKYKEWGDAFPVDRPLDRVSAGEFDALLLPGGVINPDRLRMNADAVALVRAFFDANKPVAAICHGPWLLVEADVVKGRTVTGWPSIRTDLRNAGANVVDREAVVDGDLVTSRKPDDIPAFNRAMIEVFARAKGKARKAA